MPLQLPAGAALTLEAPRIDVDSNISAVSGQLLFENVLSTAALPSTLRPEIGIGNGVTLDVSGQWTNDDIVGTGIGSGGIYQNAGSISLRLSTPGIMTSGQLTTPGSELVIGNNVSLLANGGAWLETGGTVSYGTGGTITLDASPALAALQFGSGTVLQAFGTGTADGGTFNLFAPRIEVSSGPGGTWTEAQRVDDSTSTTGQVLNLYSPLFSNYGFSAVNLTATGAVESYATNDVLTVSSGTTINAETSTLQLNGNYLAQPTGTPVASFTQVNLLPMYERPVESVSLNVERLGDDTVQLGNTNFGTLDVQTGASIVADPGATIALVGEGGVEVAGRLRAPGGTISISIPSDETVDPSDSNGLTDPGYVPSIGIDLAPTAVIDVSGTFTPIPNAQGLATGTLLAGGTVNLAAARGFVTTEAGSTIDIRGASATLDVPNTASVGGDTSEIAASAGGSLNVRAPESISLLGNLFAAAGTGNSGTAAAGSLEVDLEQSVYIANTAAPKYPTSPFEIELVNSIAGATPSLPSSNIAVLGAQQIAASGVDSLILRVGEVGGSIVLDNSQLSLGRQLILDAQTFSAPAITSLSAPTVEFENSQVTGTVPTPFQGNGTLNVQAQQLVLSGNFALQGASKVTFSSSGDVQLEGTLFAGASGAATGSILASGSLAINGLRVYPDTYTDFSLSSLPGNGATVSIGSTGTSPGTPLSADGAISISADNILVSGTVLAPFGSINLTANDSLKLASGSLVSVSGAGVDIPFGETQLNGGEWIYDTGASGGTSLNTITSVPTKQVSLSAPSVTLQSGAVVNIQGGGDLYAYEWVPGTGGSYDNLNALSAANAGSSTAFSNIPNLYAILPASKGQAGPYDPEESTQTTVGQTIYLSGGAGIAAGYYALLPARYALAPGAVLIQLESSFVSAQGGQIGALANGTPVIGGYVTSGTTGSASGESAHRLRGSGNLSQWLRAEAVRVYDQLMRHRTLAQSRPPRHRCGIGACRCGHVYRIGDPGGHECTRHRRHRADGCGHWWSRRAGQRERAESYDHLRRQHDERCNSRHFRLGIAKLECKFAHLGRRCHAGHRNARVEPVLRRKLYGHRGWCQQRGGRFRRAVDRRSNRDRCSAVDYGAVGRLAAVHLGKERHAVVYVALNQYRDIDDGFRTDERFPTAIPIAAGGVVGRVRFVSARGLSLHRVYSQHRSCCADCRG
jgi:filamentous hemagglutinin